MTLFGAALFLDGACKCHVMLFTGVSGGNAHKARVQKTGWAGRREDACVKR